MMVVFGEFGFAIFPKLQTFNRNLEFRSRKNTLIKNKTNTIVYLNEEEKGH